MCNQIKVSVIIPVYNAEKYLHQCIGSVLGQTLADIEVICVDDGSTDGSLDILREYSEKDGRVTVITQQNKFAGVARNTGMDAAKGKYYAFLDADDYITDDGLEKLYHIAEDNHLDFVKTACYQYDDTAKKVSVDPVYSNSWFKRKNQVIRFEDCHEQFMDVGDVPWNALYSAEFIKKNNLRYNNLRCANDSSFYIACLVNADRIMVCEEYLVYHRTNVAGSLVSVRYRFFENQIQSYDTICDIVNKSTVSDDVKKYVICIELIRTFLWYEKLISKKVNAFGVVDVTTRFVRDYNPEVLGKKYWNVFKNTHYIYYYNKLKKRAEINFVHEKTENPEISVIIPVDKTSIHIAECIDSVIAGDFENVEIICVNANAEASALEWVERYAQTDKRITVEKQSSHTVGGAYNRGVAFAGGKYIAFAAFDRKLDKKYISSLYSEAIKTDADIVVGTAVNNRTTADKLAENVFTFTPVTTDGKLVRKQFIVDNNISFADTDNFCSIGFFCDAISKAALISGTDAAKSEYFDNYPKTEDSVAEDFALALQRAQEKVCGTEHSGCRYKSYADMAVCYMADMLKNAVRAETLEKIYCSLPEYLRILGIGTDNIGTFGIKGEGGYIAAVIKYKSFEDYLFEEVKNFRTFEDEKITRYKGVISRGKKARSKFNTVTYSVKSAVSAMKGCYRDYGFMYTVNLMLKKLKKQK